MGIEGYGGICPKCGKPMLYKYESSSMGFMFDACPHCGFAYGTGTKEVKAGPGVAAETVGLDVHTDLTQDEVWGAIFGAEQRMGCLDGTETPEQARAKLVATHNLGDEGDGEFNPSVFIYREESTHPKYLAALGPLREVAVPQTTVPQAEDATDPFLD